MASRLPKWPILVATVAVGAACSLIVDFPEENRPCSPTGECLPGFSCMVNRCVQNGSIAEGRTCFVNELCEEGLKCVVPDFVCRKPCQNAYLDDPACPTGRACVRAQDTTGQVLAACTESQCTTTCDPRGGRNQNCINVNASVGVCLDACQVTCTGTSCQGNCLFAPNDNPQSCQYLGTNQTNGCVEEQSNNTHGDICNNLDRLCARRHACVRSPAGGNGVCLQYCDMNDMMACAGLLDPADNMPATCNEIGGPGSMIGVCGTLPAGPIGGGDSGPGGGDTNGGGGDSNVGGGSSATCREGCSGPADCAPGLFTDPTKFPKLGVSTYDCVGSRCVFQPEPCQEDLCKAQGSFWDLTSTCMDNTDCGSGACVNVDGTGYCAFTPIPGVFDCVMFPANDFQMFHFDTVLDGAGAVDVCGSPQWTCDTDDYCHVTCVTDTDCTDVLQWASITPVCDGGRCVACKDNTDCTGMFTRCLNNSCVCNDGAECMAAGNFPVCTAAGFCGCDDPLQCSMIIGGPECHSDGLCGCSSPGQCTATTFHPSTTWECASQ